MFRPTGPTMFNVTGIYIKKISGGFFMKRITASVFNSMVISVAWQLGEGAYVFTIKVKTWGEHR